MNLRALDWQHVALAGVSSALFVVLCVVAARYPSAQLWPIVGSGAGALLTTFLAILKDSPIAGEPRAVIVPPDPPKEGAKLP